MNADSMWKSFFSNWPKDLLRQGIVVTRLNEQIPFKAFMLTDTMVLLERTNPDALGTRIILLPFDQVAVIKRTTVIREKVFTGVGFVGKLSGK